MKSFFLCMFLFFFSCGVLSAEEMRFVTLLSQPVGSFSRVELLDSSKPAEIFHLNFCNTNVTSGSITVNGSAEYPVAVENLSVTTGTVLGGDVRTFNIVSGSDNGIFINRDANFRGGTLQVSTTSPAKILVNDGSAASGAAKFIHSKALSVKSADFYRMNILNTAVLDTPASGVTKSSSLSWQQVAANTSESAANKNAFLLTDWTKSATTAGN